MKDEDRAREIVSDWGFDVPSSPRLVADITALMSEVRAEEREKIEAGLNAHERSYMKVTVLLAEEKRRAAKVVEALEIIVQEPWSTFPEIKSSEIARQALQAYREGQSADP